MAEIFVGLKILSWVIELTVVLYILNRLDKLEDKVNGN